ncbi:hypothetical protein [Allorhizocola rhizosphaerae]|nr:hypothetical protein [Allorhizocola rhizosphaerae]
MATMLRLADGVTGVVVQWLNLLRETVGPILVRRAQLPSSWAHCGG